MHDPEVVVFQIKRPWPRATTMGDRKWRYWPAIVTVWHNEPGGGDALSTCKGMAGTGWSWRNVRFAVRHWRHLQIHFLFYRRVKRWLFDHCAECGYRFLWKSERHGYMSGEGSYHAACMSLRQTRMELDDLTQFVQFTADDTTKWRAEYRLKNLEEGKRV